MEKAPQNLFKISQEEDGVASTEITAADHGSIDAEGPSSEDYGKDRRNMPRLRELLRDSNPSHPPSSECCIFRVPEKLQNSYKEAYTPRVIAIGPYHSANQSLKRMEKDKQLYLKNFLQQRKMSVDDVDDFIKKIDSNMIVSIRSCYDEQIHLSNDYLADMMVLDGIFMIELFRKHHDPDRKNRPPSDRLFAKPWMLNNIRRDMMLLENQIPFFVIQTLFDEAHGSDTQPGLLNLVYSFFSPVMMKEVPGTEVKHFLDAIRFSYLPSVEARVNPRQDKEGKEGNERAKGESKCLHDCKIFVPLGKWMPCQRRTPKEIEMKFIPNATNLVKAGVKLKKSRHKSLFDIEFKRGVLKIPPLNLYHITESYFRNIIAFEKCYHEVDSCLIDYLDLIDQLVNVPADAKLLIGAGIIENWLSSERAAVKLIKSYCKDIGPWPRDTYFDSLRQSLIKHYQRPCNKWKATFKRRSCGILWRMSKCITRLD